MVLSFFVPKSLLGIEAEGRGGYHPPRSAEFSYPTKDEFNNCFIIHSKYFPVLKGASPFRSLFFPLTKNNTISSLSFLGQRFNNLQRAVLLTSLVWSKAAGYSELCVWS